jgi:hypothetical protein
MLPDALKKATYDYYYLLPQKIKTVKVALIVHDYKIAGVALGRVALYIVKSMPQYLINVIN